MNPNAFPSLKYQRFNSLIHSPQFALLNPATEGDQEYFLSQVMPWMDKLSWLERYSWFMCNDDGSKSQGTLCHADGSLSPLGNVFTYTPF